MMNGFRQEQPEGDHQFVVLPAIAVASRQDSAISLMFKVVSMKYSHREIKN